MSRAVPWVSTPSDIVSASIESAKRKSFFILKQIGPTSFILRDGASKREQQAEGNGEGHPLTYQAGYVPREIDELLRGTHVQKVQKVENTEANETEAQPANQNRRELDSEDVCPICQEELLEARLPVTWCRSCSNAAHIRCMKVWSEHQDTMARGDTDTAVQCPYCRQDFAPKDHLRKEFANTWEAGKEKTAIHKGIVCSDCSITPIKGKLYISTRGGVNLCGKCYRGGARAEMTFNVRERPGRSLKPAKRQIQNRNLELELQGREITENDYETLLNLDRSPSPDAPGVPDHILNLLPCHRVGANKRLLREGIQCLICLNPYQPTQYVKKLPKCNHYFHRDCIDTWLQNHRACPVDHQEISLRQKPPERSKTMIDILDHRHKVAPLSIGGVGTRKSGVGRPQPGGRLLNRRQTQDQAGLGQLGNRNVGDIGDLLVTRPIQRVQSAQANSPTQNAFDSDAHELPELINPLPLINFRMRNMRF